MNTFLTITITLTLLFSFFADSVSVSSFSHEDRYTTSLPLRHHRPQEYFEVTHPTPSDLPTRSCSHNILRHSFANTIDSPPFTTPYIPPPHCPPPWSRVFLQFHASCKGEQYDRIAGLWLGGAELLRTSTAEPTKYGVFWTVRKDVTRYSSLLFRSDLDLTMMLENVVNREYTGVYHVNVTLLFYGERHLGASVRASCERRSRILRDESGGGISEVTRGSWDLNESPADLIIPISDDGGRGFWFRVEGERDSHSKRIRIPPNAHCVVLELYVSFHGNDEFWYSNPPDSYITTNGLSTGRGNGAYREVYVTIDGEAVGSEIPFPVIFTGGINPLFWGPIVAIGAFDLPSYDMDLTPFLGKLLDGEEHSFGIGVTQGISFWLVNANLHIWLDHHSLMVQASQFNHKRPELTIDRQEEFIGLDGTFEVEAERETQIAGWVSSSAGNLTTIISQGFSFKNSIRFQHNGTYKLLKQKFRTKKKMKVINGKGELVASMKVKRRYPLRVITKTQPCLRSDRYLLVTNVSHAFKEKYSGSCFSNSVNNRQDSGGWMEVKDHSVLSGEATTRQNYSYNDRFNCYSRNVASASGRIIGDFTNFECES